VLQSTLIKVDYTFIFEVIKVNYTQKNREQIRKMYHELLTDMYEFSMANGYFQTLPHNKQARFDVFYRNVFRS
jgi:hypothetical protein